MARRANAMIALFFVTAAWGMTFPLIRRAVGHINPNEFVLIRLLISTAIFSPVLWWKRKYISKKLLIAGFIFGSLEAACYLTQSIGIQTISSANSAFITALSVVIAPFLAPLFGLAKPRWFDIIAAGICITGIFILSGADLESMQSGVYWTLACAVFYALSVNYLSRVTKYITENLTFVGLQISLGLPLPIIALSITGRSGHWHGIAIAAVTFCALSTLASYYLQTRFQRRLSVAQVMLIFAFEPIFATIFAMVINNEIPTRHTLIGGGFVIASFLFSQLLSSRTNQQPTP